MRSWGIITLDFESQENVWGHHSPKDADVMMLEQAVQAKAIAPNTKIYVYRNLAQAYVRIRIRLCLHARCLASALCLTEHLPFAFIPKSFQSNGGLPSRSLFGLEGWIFFGVLRQPTPWVAWHCATFAVPIT